MQLHSLTHIILETNAALNLLSGGIGHRKTVRRLTENSPFEE